MNIMLDLETYGTGRDAAIRSIGSCIFDPATGALGNKVGCGLQGTFHWGVELWASKSPGHIDSKTVDWWLEQPREARLALARLQKESLENVLERWRIWVSSVSVPCGIRPRLWSNGPLFDERILREAFDRNDMQFPIHFRESRCFRTIVNLGLPMLIEPGAGVKHNALADCFRQARTVIKAYQLLGIN